MKKIIALLIAVVLTAVLFVGCGKKEDKTDAAYILDKKTLIVGITDFEPMDYQAAGMTGDEWTGFDAELAKKVGEKLGVSVKFQLVDWEKKETELASKTIDCLWNGLTWDEERAQNMSMSDYYMRNRQVLVVAGKNKEKLNTIEALSKVKIAAESGSAGEKFIGEKLPDATYIEKDAQKDVLTELLAGTVDAGVIDYIMAYYLINKEGSDFSSLAILDGVVKTEEEYYAVAFRKGSDMTAKVNEILREFKADGTVKKLAEKYSLQDALAD
mgnify:CR=1 FL=1